WDHFGETVAAVVVDERATDRHRFDLQMAGEFPVACGFGFGDAIGEVIEVPKRRGGSGTYLGVVKVIAHGWSPWVDGLCPRPSAPCRRVRDADLTPRQHSEAQVGADGERRAVGRGQNGAHWACSNSRSATSCAVSRSTRARSR